MLIYPQSISYSNDEEKAVHINKCDYRILGIGLVDYVLETNFPNRVIFSMMFDEGTVCVGVLHRHHPINIVSN